MGLQKPWLQRTHQGYYRIILSILVSHVALAIDCSVSSWHSAPVYTYVRSLLPIYAAVHVIVAVGLALALVIDERWWWVARAACFVSLLTFNTFAVGMFFGAVFHKGSFIGPIGLVALSISSFAAWREPTVGPAYRSLTTRAT